MPIFEYKCAECGKEFELFVRSRAAEGEGQCPHCQSQKIQKQFSTFASKSTAAAGSQTAPAAPACTGPV